MKELEVLNCNNCPFLNNDYEFGSACNFPGSKVENHDIPWHDAHTVAEKCPLKEVESLTIKLKKQNDKSSN